MTTTNPTWNDVLLHLMEEDPEHTHASLVSWCTRYPEFTKDLTDYFAFWADQDARSDFPQLDEARLRAQAVSRALSHAHTLTHQTDPTAAHSTPARLTELARAHGVADDDLAAACRLDLSVIIKLDRRRITPLESIPQECLHRLGHALNEPWIRVREAICGPPLRTATGGLRKAGTKATLSTETFADAIRASTLSEDDQRYWLSLARSEIEHQ